MRRERARAYIVAMRSTATRSEALDKLVAALQSGVCDSAEALLEREGLGERRRGVVLLDHPGVPLDQHGDDRPGRGSLRQGFYITVRN